MRIIVTGGAGAIGRHTVARLVADKHEVVSADRAYLKIDGAESRVVDLRRREDAYVLFDRADAIVHLANHPNDRSSDPQTVLAENLAINVNVCQAAADLGVGQLVFASSIQAISGTPPLPPEGTPPRIAYLPADGDSPANPGNIYGLSKVLSEQMLAHYFTRHGLSSTAIRFPWVCQKPRHAHHQSRMRDFERRDAHELGAWLWVEDAASLVSAVLKAELKGFRIYLPTGPLPAAFGSAEEIARQHYAHTPRRQPEVPLEALIDIGRITAETGWTPHSFEDVLRIIETG